MNIRPQKDPDSNISHSWSMTSIKARIVVCGLAILCWAVIFAAWRVVPDNRGYGSHKQLGIPKCQWIKESNTPCPTCGMTTAYSLTVRGKLIPAILTQPAGCILALTHLILTGLFSFIVITGKYPVYFTAWINYNTFKILSIYIIIILAGWAYTYLKIKYCN